MKRLALQSFILVSFNLQSCDAGIVDKSELNSLPEKNVVAEERLGKDILSPAINKFNRNAVFLAIYSLEGNSLKSFCPEQNIKIVQLHSLIEKNADTLTFLLSRYSAYLNGFDKSKQNETLQRIDKWCSLYFLFNTLADLNYGEEQVYHSQIIYEIPQTKSLFNKYLVDKAQDWGSLDVSQGYLVYYDFLKYLSGLSSKEQASYINLYITKAKKLAANSQ